MPTDVSRCAWALQGDEDYVAYHDHEWGVPVHDDQVHFEFLLLESAQAGLSWSTVLRKREGYRRAFAQFDAKRVARFSEQRIAKLADDPSIIRHRQKIRAAVSNAQVFLAIQTEFGDFDTYLWQFVDGSTVQNTWRQMADVPTTSAESDALSRDLKQRGFKFFGSTIAYAYLQAVGLINDHTTDCFRHRELRDG